jgi:hypothetical protein
MAVKLHGDMSMTNWLSGAVGLLGTSITRYPALPPHQPPVTTKEEFVEARRVFDALDGHDLYVSGHSWRMEVFSVSDEAQHRWVQLGLSGDQTFMLTLRLNAGAGEQPAIEALSSWLGRPSESPVNQILNVA